MITCANRRNYIVDLCNCNLRVLWTTKVLLEGVVPAFTAEEQTRLVTYVERMSTKTILPHSTLIAYKIPPLILIVFKICLK